MWRPPERIRHHSQAGPMPSAEEAAGSRLFSPVAVGRIILEQRSWLPAMVPWRATDDGFVSQDVIDWYSRFAQGQPGAIVVEATGIRDIPSGPLLRIGHDRYVEGLKQLVAAVREASCGKTRLFIQIIDFLAMRRRPAPAKFFERFLTITDAHRAATGQNGASDEDLRTRLAAMPEAELDKVLSARELETLRYGYREKITDTNLPHIAELPHILPELFAKAAIRAEQAGFDGVELHYAHAYTMASFLSTTNSRSDGYGSTLEGRLRLPLEVFSAVRQAVSPDFAVGCRFLADECIDGGTKPDESVAIGLAFAKAGMDFLSTSRGGKFDDAKQPGIDQAAYPYTGPSGYECMPQFISDEQGPFVRNIAPTKAIRDAIRAEGLATPVVCSGGVHNFAMAEAMLADGICDIVGAARQALADPDWLVKIRLGRGAEARICEYSNYCEGLDQKHKQVTCQLWDKMALDDKGVRLARDGKRRLTAPAWTAPRG